MKNIAIVTRLLALTMTIAFISCGGSGGDGGEVPTEQKTPPAKTVGTLPANGEPCSDYQEVPSDASKVLISFEWNSAQYAETYRLVITEGASEVYRNSYSALQAEVQLDRGKTYTWSLTAINGDGETKGDTYSFTTPGTPVGNFAPYAADISIAFNMATAEMSVSWVGSDEDGDPLRYDVTVWEAESMLIEILDSDFESIDPIIYKAGGNYTVEVVSKDTSGNFSIASAYKQAPK